MDREERKQLKKYNRLATHANIGHLKKFSNFKKVTWSTGDLEIAYKDYIYIRLKESINILLCKKLKSSKDYAIIKSLYDSNDSSNLLIAAEIVYNSIKHLKR